MSAVRKGEGRVVPDPERTFETNMEAGESYLRLLASFSHMRSGVCSVRRQ